MEVEFKMIIFMMVVMTASLWVVLERVFRIESHLKENNDKNKNERFWGWGKHKK